MTALTVWVISDGRRGIENQALGLAEAMGRLRPLTISRYIISHTGLFAKIPAALQFTVKRRPADFGFPEDLPDIAIGCGRQAIAPLRALRCRGVFTIYVQDPRTALTHFDCVVAPEHDELTGSNLVTMIGSPNRVTADILKAAQVQFSQELSKLPQPRAALLIGGPSKARGMSEATHAAHVSAAKGLCARGYSLMISPSRRTPDWAVQSFADLARQHNDIWLYEGGEDNPYFAFLAGAQLVLVTEESTNMLTEACATGRPVYRLPMDGPPGKFNKLYAALEARCGLLPYTDDVAAPGYPPLIETQDAAAALWERFEQRKEAA